MKALAMTASIHSKYLGRCGDRGCVESTAPGDVPHTRAQRSVTLVFLVVLR